MNNNRKNYFKCNSYNELLGEMQPGGKLAKVQNQYLFRGQSRDLPLIPQIMRSPDDKAIRSIVLFYAKDFLSIKGDYNFEKLEYDAIDNIEYVYRLAEYNILKEFYNSMNTAGLQTPYSIFENHKQFDLNDYLYNDEWLPHDLIDIAALARHYGVPTRLLDWSFDINVALYFASIGALKKIVKNENEIKENIIIWLLNKDIINSYTSAENLPLRIVVPNYYTNPNVCLQKGALTYWWNKKDDPTTWARSIAPLDVLLNCNYAEIREKTIFTISIPRTECLKIIRHLYNNGYNASRLFSGYSGAARKIEENLLISQAEQIFKNYKLCDEKMLNMVYLETLDGYEMRMIKAFRKMDNDDKLDFIGRGEGITRDIKQIAN